MYYTNIFIHLPSSPRQALACPVAPATSYMYICTYVCIYTYILYTYIYTITSARRLEPHICMCTYVRIYIYHKCMFVNVPPSARQALACSVAPAALYMYICTYVCIYIYILYIYMYTISSGQRLEPHICMCTYVSIYIYYKCMFVNLPPSARRALACPVAPAALHMYICTFVCRDIYTIQMYLRM